MTYEPLFPCPACHRHVRAAEPCCPFCGAAPTPHLGRHGALAAAALFAGCVALGGCHQEDPTASPDRPYKIKSDGASASATPVPTPTAPDDYDVPRPKYGMPYVPTPPDGGATAVRYGAPPPPPVLPVPRPAYGVAPPPPSARFPK